MEWSLVAARHSWARQHAWLLLSFFPFPVRHPPHPPCTFKTEMFLHNSCPLWHVSSSKKLYPWHELPLIVEYFLKQFFSQRVGPPCTPRIGKGLVTHPLSFFSSTFAGVCVLEEEERVQKFGEELPLAPLLLSSSVFLVKEGKTKSNGEWMMTEEGTAADEDGGCSRADT